jgi:phage terminase small subunit
MSTTLPALANHQPLQQTHAIPSKPASPPQLSGATRKMKRFVEFKIQGESDTQAALKAGYSPSTSANASVAIRRHPWVVRELERRKQEVFGDLELDTKQIVNNVRLMAEWNIADYGEINPDGTFRWDLSKITREQAYVIEEIDFSPEGRMKVKLPRKKDANELLAKFKKLGAEPLERGAGLDGTPLTVNKLDALVKHYIQNVTVNVNSKDFDQTKYLAEDSKTIEAITEEIK